MNDTFDLEKEYKEKQGAEKGLVFISGGYDKYYDTFKFTGDLGKPISLFFVNSEIRNFYFENLSYKRNNYEIQEIVFQDIKFEKTNSNGEYKNYDFLYCDPFNTLEKIKISYLNKKTISEANLNFSHFSTKVFEISDSKFGNNKYRIKKSYIKKIHISNPINLGNLLIENIQIGTLFLENINPVFENFELRNLDIGELIIYNSNLGKAILNGIVTEKLTIINVNLNECIFNNIGLKSYDLGDSIYGDKLTFLGLKDNYRQLKFVMDKNGNYTEANKFFAKEMETYMDTIEIENFSISKAIVGFFEDTKSKNIGDKISLLFSYRISNFGENWIQAFFNLIFFIVYANFFTTIYIGLAEFFHFKNILNDSLFYNYKLFSGIFLLLTFIGIIFLVVYTEGKFHKIKKISKYIFFNKGEIIYFGFVFVFLIVIFSIFSIDYFVNYKIDPNTTYVFNSWRNLFELTYPLYGFDKDIISKYSSFEMFFLIIYKIIYGVILWHLIVAAKRTTKR